MEREAKLELLKDFLFNLPDDETLVKQLTLKLDEYEERTIEWYKDTPVEDYFIHIVKVNFLGSLLDYGCVDVPLMYDYLKELYPYAFNDEEFYEGVGIIYNYCFQKDRNIDGTGLPTV